ncbi:5-oxoprolinase/urea amidolyase family protein [Micropruina sp.]|uniref:5-oxoprolinase subunit B/C family protein n=1 Tax=Micropruina sp. TaxID=2737536 RepID=UPI0039E39C56
MDGRLLPCGERALLIEVDGLDAAIALRTALASLAGRGAFGAVRDVVPAATTVLLSVDDPDSLTGVRDAVTALLPGLDPATGPTGRDEPVEIDVRYDGEDLAEVARLTGLTPDEVIAAHTGRDWTVAFGGFAPGFAYLVDGDERLQVPRRAEPRTRVPPGAVGLAGPFSGIYPRASPGGWQLIGSTDVTLWDADRTPPALLQPGGRVRFRAVDQKGPDRGLDKLDQRAASLDRRGALTVLAAGPLTLFVDEGRPGYAAVGVSASGAADRASYRLANRLVGNPSGAAALEITLGGLALRAASSCLLAITGADCSPTVDGRPVTHAGPVYLRPGQTLRLGVPSARLRSYLAVAGGFEVPPALGSASSDTLSGLGPPRLTAGDRLAVGAAPIRLLNVDSVPRAPLPEAERRLDVLPGPRSDWLADPSELFGRRWRLSEHSDRVGVRVLGEPLRRRPELAGRELPSEPMVRGSIQVPPDGRPVIFGADHPVTGGYPVVGVLTEAANDALAQARPGDWVRFRRAEQHLG